MKGRREKWWERRNNLEKILIVIIALLLCFVLFVFIVVMLHFHRLFANDTPLVKPCTASEGVKTTETVSTGAKSCLTPACVKAAAQIIDFVNVSADPCDDFYEFTCATFHRRWTETDKLTGIKTLQTLIGNRINALITEPTDRRLPKALELQRRFYNSCTNTTEIDEDENDTFLNLIEKVGGWPIMRGRFWNGKKFTWFKAIIKCRKLGIEIGDFLKITKKQVAVNGTELILLSVSPPATTIVPSYFRDDYIELLTNLSLQLNAISYNYAKEEFIRVFNFQDKIKNISADKEENSSNTLLQVKTLQEEIPNIPWIEFLNDLFVTGIPFNNDSWVDFPVMKYLQKLGILLENTPKSTQANYIMWRIVENHRNYLSGTLRQQYNSFLIKLNPALVTEDRKSFCLTKAKFYFPSVAERTYLKNYVRKQTSSHIKQITKNIKKQMQDAIEKSKLFEQKFKETIITQLDDIIDSQNFNTFEEMETFDLQDDNIIDMDTQLYARTIDNYFKDVNRRISDIKEEKLKTFSIFNNNAIKYQETPVLYTLFLDQITSHLRSPYYVNYGSMGSAIGRELTRFVFQKYKINTIWSHNISKLDEERKECLLNHQNSSNEDQIPRKDPQEVSEESLVYGSIGADLAYKAYNQWVSDNGPEQTLPGLSYTQNQTFWIMFAISECLQLGRNYIENEDHTTPPPTSIAISTQDSTDFAAAFNCPAASEKKCQMP